MKESEIVRLDMMHVECRPWGGEDLNKVKTSLSLGDCGKMGSRIAWCSSNPSVITGLGRVIRPKWGEPPAKVSMTASVSCGGISQKKVFDLTVLPDDTYADPGYDSDENFFQKLDYRRTGLKAVKKSVEAGDYADAKAELLQYFRQKQFKRETFEKFPTGMSEMMLSGVSTLQRCDRYYKGKFQVDSEEYEEQRIQIQCGGLSNGMTVTYDVCAKYNETVGIKIAGSAFENTHMRPVLEVVTAAGIKRFNCQDSAVVGAGSSADVSLKMRKELYAKMFGGFWGSGTFHSLVRFQIDGLESAAEKASLILYTKKDMALDGTKELLVLLFPHNTWDGGNVKWNDFKWQSASRSGLPQPDTWDLEKGFDFEYLFQRVRFKHFPWLLEEYRQSGNEEIPYYLIKTMADFIQAKGMPFTYRSGQHEHIGNAWRDDTTSRTLCGGWPRGLDAAERIRAFASVFGELVQSRFMTAEVCTAILKYAWDACHALAFQSLTKPFTNLRQFEVMGLFEAAVVFSEFQEQDEWIRAVHQTMEDMMFSVTLEDGTYNEMTGGYNMSVCQNFVDFKKHGIENGYIQSEAFDLRLKRFARYNVLLQGPDGESLQYGDQAAGRCEGVQFSELMAWFQDEELTYLLSRGEQGKRPEWTSFRFPVSGAAMLRSDWGRDAVYLFTQARGGGSHGHQDDNHITLLAGGRVLLTDAGIFTYTPDDPYRRWGVSPLAHNTVCINELEQEYWKGPGACEEFITAPLCDILSQSTRRYQGFSYTRRIVFVKPAVFIITDKIVPEDKKQENWYRQPWHMLPTAKISFDYKEKRMRSNYKDGPNIFIQSLDKDVKLKREQGWYDYGYQQLSENPYGYFERRDVKGSVVFHTMIQIVEDGAAARCGANFPHTSINNADRRLK